MYSLVASSVCPSQGSNVQPWRIRTMLQPTKLPGQSQGSILKCVRAWELGQFSTNFPSSLCGGVSCLFSSLNCLWNHAASQPTLLQKGLRRLVFHLLLNTLCKFAMHQTWSKSKLQRNFHKFLNLKKYYYQFPDITISTQTADLCLSSQAPLDSRLASSLINRRSEPLHFCWLEEQVHSPCYQWLPTEKTAMTTETFKKLVPLRAQLEACLNLSHGVWRRKGLAWNLKHDSLAWGTRVRYIALWASVFSCI